MNLFNQHYTREQLMRQIGRIEQIGGLRQYTLADGPGRGMRAIDVNTGSGLVFTLLPDRGLDISKAAYNGASLCWISPAGEQNPAFCSSSGAEWLRTFGGGLLVTCGLTHMGTACQDAGDNLGLHGTYSATPAEQVSCMEQWRQDEYEMSVRGLVREAYPYGPRLVLEREIVTRLGSSKFTIYDRVRNDSARSVPLMILYHFNFGFPLFGVSSRLALPSRRAVLRDTREEVDVIRYGGIGETPPDSESVYYHEMKPDAEGWVNVVLANLKFDGGRGLGVCQRYRAENLPWFVQWVKTEAGNWVLGLEPCNCSIDGRANARREGVLSEIKCGESREFIIEIEVLPGCDQIKRALAQFGLEWS